jgi:transposase-like protein
MTARDEIILRTPDALMNGSSIVDVFQSCCSAVKDGWAVPNVDVDALLIGIRIASYGNILDISSKCPHCQNENTHGIDLGSRLQQLKCPDFDKTLSQENLVFRFRPMPYFAITKEKTVSFYQEKMFMAISNTELDETTRTNLIRQHAKDMLAASIEALTHQTEFIQLDTGEKVNEFDFIKEFYENTDSEVIKKTQRHLTDLLDEVKPPEIMVMCESCQKNYELPIEFDYSNFFG